MTNAQPNKPGPGGQTIIDQSAMTVNQIFIISLPILGFIFDTPWPLVFTAICMSIGLVVHKWQPFTLFYKHVVKPLHLMKPQPRPDDPAPHRFAHLLGAIFLFVAAGCLFLGYSTLGWILCWIVVFLAQLNMQAHFCVGCFLYLQMTRLINAQRRGAEG
jgi:hypothetical protein